MRFTDHIRNVGETTLKELLSNTSEDYHSDKECAKCLKTLPLDDFYDSKTGKHGKYSYCKKCTSSYRRSYLYGLEKNDYRAILKLQGGCCAICGTKGKNLHVDHCHDTGMVRGLLCVTCNTGLGKFGDDSAKLKKAIEYLDNFWDGLK